MKTMVIILILVTTLFVFHASSLDCSYFIEQACLYGNTEPKKSQKRCEYDALPLCKEDKECEACKKACNEGNSYVPCHLLCFMDFSCVHKKAGSVISVILKCETR